MNLQRSRDDRVIAGVCGGIAKRMGVSSINVRIAFVLLGIFVGLSFIGYLIAWLVIPEEK